MVALTLGVPPSPILLGVFVHQEQFVWISEASGELQDIERKIARPLDGLRFDTARRDSPPKLPTMRRNSKTDSGRVFVMAGEVPSPTTQRRVPSHLPLFSSQATSPTTPTDSEHSSSRRSRLNSATSASSQSSFTSSLSRTSISTSSTSDGVAIVSLGHISEDADLDDLSYQLDQLAKSSSPPCSPTPSGNLVHFSAVKWAPSSRTANESSPTQRSSGPTSPNATPTLSAKAKTFRGPSMPGIELQGGTRLAVSNSTQSSPPASPTPPGSYSYFGAVDCGHSSGTSDKSPQARIDLRKQINTTALVSTQASASHGSPTYLQYLADKAALAAESASTEPGPSTPKRVPRPPTARSSPLYRVSSKDSQDSQMAILVDTTSGLDKAKQRKYISLAEALRDADLDTGPTDETNDVQQSKPVKANGKTATSSPHPFPQPMRIRFPERLSKPLSSPRLRTQSAPTSPAPDVLAISDWLDGWRVKQDTVAPNPSPFPEVSKSEASRPIKLDDKAAPHRRQGKEESPEDPHDSARRTTTLLTSAIPLKGRLNSFATPQLAAAPKLVYPSSDSLPDRAAPTAAVVATGSRRTFTTIEEQRKRAQTTFERDEPSLSRTSPHRVRFADTGR